MAEGIEVRHSRSCVSRDGKRCNCEPGYRVAAYDAISKRKVSKTFRTLAEARRWRAGAQTQAAKGVRLAGIARTLNYAAETFVDGITAGTTRAKNGERYKPSVVREYERSLRLHVLPALGGAKLSRIQRRDVQRLADEMLASGADPSTIRNALKPLQAIYRRAIEDGDLALNPCERLRLPAARGRRERIASPSEAAALIGALRIEDRALWGCAFYAGLRRGELRALVWDDVDLAVGLIHVERSMTSHGETGEPKSRAGRRGVPIVAALRDLLVEHKLVTRRDAGLVFGPGTARPFTPTAVRKRALTAWRRAGLDPIGLHECRHTFASLLIAAGVNAKAITAYLGHASIQTTFDLYGHLMPGNEDEAVALVDAYLERAATATRLTQLD
ncbi:MAG TPA: tyrosine-type recombinase/integrase [Gaiellaceae bacterium]|jgi:integrase|nr:tyrosine-type recombinase/integrase [Gaiellaceae bacterium]